MSNHANQRPAHRNSGATASGGGQDKKEAVAEEGRQQAEQLKGQARESGQRVAGAAASTADQVKNEAVGQAQNLLGQLTEDLRQHAAPQQEKVAGAARALTEEISAVSRGEAPETSYVTGLLGSVVGPAESVTRALETKEPRELVDDVRRFAARRPGTFLALAAGIGLLAGRATRSAKDSDEIATSGQDVKEYLGMDDEPSDVFAQGGQDQPERTLTEPVPESAYPRVETRGGGSR